jgi:trimethylamine--corrinoid protein Co-methyltransferase
VEDAMEMVKIASGLDEKEFFSKPRIFTNINSTSPLKHDWPMLDGAMRFAKKNQPVVVTPFTLAGAMSPVTIVGSVAQALAEALAAIALLQYISPGCPCILGTFTSNVDMKSGAPAFGTPEYIRATQVTGQMARFYKIPLRASNACASNAPDAQATWESSNSLWSTISAGINMVYHGAGWLEGGLIASYEKFIIDCEMIQQLQRYLDPDITGTSEEQLAISAIEEVGHNGHFFGASHTQERYQDAFYAPFLSDWRNYEAWEADGKITTEKRANRVWKQLLEEFKPPPISSKIEGELDSFVQKREREGGAATNF